MMLRNIVKGRRSVGGRTRSLVVVGVAVAMAAGIGEAVENDRPAGPPYAPSGKRIVFTTWYYVRPGQPDWIDAEGRSLYADRSAHDPEALRYVYRDRPYGIRLEAEPAQRRGPIVARDRAWEADGLGPGTLMLDDGKYRLWAHCGTGRAQHQCYLESRDGLTWTKPELKLVDYEGSTANNLLPVRLGGVFKDPSAPAESRYKAARHHRFASMEQFAAFRDRHPWTVMAGEMDVGKVHAIVGATSADGIRWKELEMPIAAEPSDTQVIAYFDERIGKYVMYTRSYMLGPRAPGYPPPDPSMYQFLARRSIGRTESDTFDYFPPAQTILEPTPHMSPTAQIYTNCRTTIPGAPDHHVFFPTVFYLESDTTRVSLYGSYDGRMLHGIPGGPVLETADYGQWDGGCVFAVPNLVELPDGSWVLPYAGYRSPHKYPHAGVPFDIGYAVWPKGRLVALRADGEGGFTTPALIAPGSRLRINAVTRRVGSIQVEAADLEGVPLAGRSFEESEPVKGDQHWTAVRWKGHEDLGVEAGEPVVLRFRMKMARLYGLEFE